MKAIIYSRVSHSSGQSSVQSNSRQINELKAIKGYEVKKVFQETISGYTKSVKERPELQKALKFVDANQPVTMNSHSKTVAISL